MKVALAFLSKDRVDLSERTIWPLLGVDADLFWVDGSVTDEGKSFPGQTVFNSPLVFSYDRRVFIHPNVRGGPDAAVAYALTVMLAGGDYTHVGLVENDVLLHPDWFGPTLALFSRGESDGLSVGAVSARAYDDRILFQRDGYAVCHGLGWGQVIFTRAAAQLSLANMRTGMTYENRRTFAQLAGKDIGTYWAFRAMEHNLCADWGNDRMLASYGLASLALVPSPVEMIGQVPPLHEQGLKIASEPVELLRDDKAFDNYVLRTTLVRDDHWQIPTTDWLLQDNPNGYMIFPHHVPNIGGIYEGDWRLKWTMGFGPFAWRAGGGIGDPVRCEYEPTLTVPVSGPVSFLVSGGEKGGKVRLGDTHSGYELTPELLPEGPDGKIMQLTVPGVFSYRTCKLTMLTPGTIFYGLRTVELQPWLSDVSFDWHTLPKV